MTAKELFDISLELLGYTDSTGSAQLVNRMRSRAFAVMNQVCSDLYFAVNPSGIYDRLYKWEDKINLPDRIVTEVAPYGVASFLASGEGDGENMQVFSAIYNQKRALLSRFEKVIEGIPVGEDL